MKENNRIAFIDRMKGLAIILVVIGHLLKTGEDGVLYQFIYSFHMPLFMFLSGIVVKDGMSFRKLLYKMTQFLCPFLVVGILFTCANGITILDFIMSPKKLGFWYLLVLAFFYIFVFLNRIIGKSSLVKDILFFVGIYAVLYLACSHLPDLVVNSLSLAICYQNWPFFVVGFLVHRYNSLFVVDKINILYSFALILFIPAYLIWIHSGHLYVIEAMLAIVVIYYSFMIRDTYNTIVEQVLAYIGKNSLDIYIYHCFITPYVVLGNLNRYLESTGNILVESVLNLSIALLVILVSMMIGKGVRMSNWLSYVVYGFNRK